MSAPDLIEPLVGYRAWRLNGDGTLVPWTLSAAGAWQPGVNRARCHATSFDARKRSDEHRAPAAGCKCGLYALNDPRDPRLALNTGRATGAIAAWGDVEMHRTGFRAEYATVVALASPARSDDETERRLSLAAEHYGVELVPALWLSAAARRHGRPLEQPGEPEAGSEGPTSRIGERGIAMDEHVWATARPAHVELGITGAFASLLYCGCEVTLPPVGTVIGACDPLATIAVADQTLIVWACISGTVVERNEVLRDDPDLVREAPEHRGWLARVAPSAWDKDQRRFNWDPMAEKSYAAQLGRARAGIDVFFDLRAEHLFGPSVTKPGDIALELRRRAAQPSLAMGGELVAACIEAVNERLAADPSLGASIGSLGLTIGYRIRGLDAQLTLTARDGHTRLAPGAPARADMKLEMDADSAMSYFTGRLDLARALRSGEVRSSCDLVGTLRTASVLKHLFGREGRPRAPTYRWG